MTDATLNDCQAVAEMEAALSNARRLLIRAEIDLIYAAHGLNNHLDSAKAGFAEAAEILKGAGTK
jgi:hypothetical protein